MWSELSAGIECDGDHVLLVVVDGRSYAVCIADALVPHEFHALDGLMMLDDG